MINDQLQKAIAPPPPKPFCNPYDVESALEHKRIHTEVTREDYLLIKLLRPDQGTIKNVIGLLWKQLCYELRQLNLTDNTSCEQFESFVANCRIIPSDDYDALREAASQWADHCARTGHLLDRTPGDDGRRSSKTDGGDDRKRAKGVRAKSPNQSAKLTNVPSGGSVEGGQGQ